jgi:hypothetical protein
MSAIRLTEQGADPTRPDPYALRLRRSGSGSGAQAQAQAQALRLRLRLRRSGSGAQAQATRPAYPPILAYGVAELESMIRFGYRIGTPAHSANRTEMEIPKWQHQQQRQQRQQ